MPNTVDLRKRAGFNPFQFNFDPKQLGSILPEVGQFGLATAQSFGGVPQVQDVDFVDDGVGAPTLDTSSFQQQEAAIRGSKQGAGGRIFNSTLSGASLGSKFGPGGLIAGTVGGLLTGGIGQAIRKRRANRRLKELRQEREQFLDGFNMANMSFASREAQQEAARAARFRRLRPTQFTSLV